MSFVFLTNLVLIILPTLCLASPIKDDQSEKDQEFVFELPINDNPPVLSFAPATSAKLLELPDVKAWDFLSYMTSFAIASMLSERAPLEQRLMEEWRKDRENSKAAKIKGFGSY